MVNGFSSDEATDVSESEVDDNAEKSYTAPRTGNHGIHNQDGTFRCPFCPGKMKQCYQFKDLFQHAKRIAASNSRKRSLKAQHRAFARFLQHNLAYPLPWEDLKATIVGGVVPATAVATNSEPPPKEELFHATGITASNSHKSSLKAQHRAFARFLQHDLAYPLRWEDLKATVVGGTVPATAIATNSEPPPKEKLFVRPWVVVLVNADPSDIEGEANSFADQLSDFHPTDTVFLHLEDEKGGRSTGTTGGGASALHGWLVVSDDYNEDCDIGRYLRKHDELKTIKQHAMGITASNSRKSSLKAQHRAFTRFLQHDLAYSLHWEDLKATVIGGVVPATATATN
ncbi:hypothetical protein ZIOFF_058479 [Zingiber officinale]|uniref:Zinc finger-XS domain-containing protein n=1 Tax=Zingiber officinale TaxID=94328 RepID=A0A8J5F695_ZINOF|nr:hypothetical protein ZIOFF_058479 [Zingiber officinale]